MSQSSRTTLPVINATDIENTWDFDLNYNVAGGAIGVSENNPILPAITQQLGLRIELQQAPARVLVVESVNPSPTPNSVNVGERLPPDITHFEVASIRPCESVDFGMANTSGGLVTTGCQRFKVATHYEPREVPVKVLTAEKTKFVRGDTSARPRCEFSGALPGVPTVLDCRNVTITQFAQELESSGLSVGRVVDETKLEGTWDLKVTYGGSLPGTRGGIPLSDGIEQQLGLKFVDAKRLIPVVVIDHIDERPTEN